MAVYILGTGLSHNGSAVLMKDGKIIVGIEKERITRIKHDGGNDRDAVQYCLDAAGITVHDLNLVVQCANFEKDIPLTTYKGQRLFPADFDIPVITISHHLAHAYSAAGTSPFTESHVFVLDGCGSPYTQCDDLHGALNLAADEMGKNPGGLYCEKDSFYHYGFNSVKPLVKDFSIFDMSRDPGLMDLPTTHHSIGGLYSAASSYCFGNMDDAGKLMGLAPFGRPSPYNESIFSLENERVMVRGEWKKGFNTPAHDYFSFKQNFQYYADIACWVQHEVEEAILYVIKERIKRSKATKLCYSGGVALNALANKRIIEETGIEALYIEPASADNGLALGCVYYGWMQILKKEKIMHDGDTCFGKIYRNEEIRNAISMYNGCVTAVKSENIAADAAGLLADGKVIGWFQDGSEFGPRALGRRSILADPRKKGVKDFINAEIKKREDFRPFAPSMLREDLETYYRSDTESPYMLLVNEIRPEFEKPLQAIVHHNKTSRVQTVTPGWNGKFCGLLQAFKKKTGLPMLLNTSFNKRGMPIVETPEDAITFFAESRLDHLVIHDLIISRDKTNEFKDELTGRLVDFIRSVGIEVEKSEINEETFLPGILIRYGRIIVDENKLKYAGDLLHEAGHLAVIPPSERIHLYNTVVRPTMKKMDEGAEEMAAIAWSYAALKHLDLAPEVVFHPDGYKGGSEALINAFASGPGLGVPLLGWWGLTYDEKTAQAMNKKPFPAMIKWMREDVAETIND